MKADEKTFLDTLWRYYDTSARLLPWRTPEADGRLDPYKILVSEIMLQQTQVERVIPKYLAFLHRFPTIDALQSSELSDVIALWSGLGYNRRAKYLHDISKKLRSHKQPWTVQGLTALKGIGQNTAAAICVYSYNQPHVFIETNIRTIYLHHFFLGKKGVSDAQIIELVERTLDRVHPREFYWALMDYGTHLKKQGIRNNNHSQHYKKQLRFEGSKRQVRGMVMRLLAEHGSLSPEKIQREINDSRLGQVLADLEREEMIASTNNSIHIA